MCKLVLNFLSASLRHVVKEKSPFLGDLVWVPKARWGCVGKGIPIESLGIKGGKAKRPFSFGMENLSYMHPRFSLVCEFPLFLFLFFRRQGYPDELMSIVANSFFGSIEDAFTSGLRYLQNTPYLFIVA